jgi:hypothetical protein
MLSVHVLSRHVFMSCPNGYKTVDITHVFLFIAATLSLAWEFAMAIDPPWCCEEHVGCGPLVGPAARRLIAGCMLGGCCLGWLAAPWRVDCHRKFPCQAQSCCYKQKHMCDIHSFITIRARHEYMTRKHMNAQHEHTIWKTTWISALHTTNHTTRFAPCTSISLNNILAK